MRFTREGTGKTPARVLGRIGLSLFLSIFLAAGLLFLFFIGAALRESLETYGWKKTPATMVRSGVREEPKSDEPFSVEVEYRYAWEGETFTSRTFSKQSIHYEDYDRALKKAAAFPEGTATVCYLNPQDPGEAVLQRDGLWIALFAAIPLIFVLVGGGGIVGVWFPRQAQNGSPGPTRSGRKGGKGVPIFLGGIFALVGAGLLIFWFLPTVWKALDSARWTETPCTIISSRVKSHSDSDGTTYSVDIFYRYVVAGKEHKSNRHGHFGGASSGDVGKAKAVKQYPAGASAVCYVNPQNPGEAVLKRGLGWSALFGLIPLAFLLAGLAIIFYADKIAPTVSASGRPALPGTGLAGPAGQGPRVLKSTSPLARLAGVILAAMFWNGIVSVFLWQVVESFQRGRPDWFLTVFLIPFVLVGLALLLAIGYAAAAATNPRCRLQVDPPFAQPGQTLSVAWEFRGSVRRLSRLRIFLEGREEATYARGTSTCTDKEVFAQILLAEVSSGMTGMDMGRGTARCTVPARTMPSFTAPHNKVVWVVKVRGEIARWPDVDEEYVMVIVPTEGEWT